MRTTSHVPSPLIWHISQIIVDVLSSIVSTCFLNQFHGYWLFFDALNATITMSLKLKEKIRISSNLEDLIYDDSIGALKLSLLAFKIRREVGV
jgi:hypothetical protein